MDFGPAEIAIVLLIVVMVFGASRIGELGGSLGQGIKEFRNALKEDDDGAPATQVNQASPEMDEVPASGSTGVDGVNCASCGIENPSGARFCSSCGAEIAIPVP